MFRTDRDNLIAPNRESQRARAMAMPYTCRPCVCDMSRQDKARQDESRVSVVAGLIWTIVASLVFGHNLTKGGWP